MWRLCLTVLFVWAFSTAAWGQTERDRLLAERETVFQLRQSDRAAWRAARDEIQPLTQDTRQYQAELAATQPYCTQTFESVGEYNARLAECLLLRETLNAWRQRLVSVNSALNARITDLAGRVEAHSARLRDIDAQVAALGASTAFEAEMASARALQGAQIQRLTSEIDAILVPPPQATRYEVGVILGMMNGPDQAARLGLTGIDPFTGRPFRTAIAADRAGFTPSGRTLFWPSHCGLSSTIRPMQCFR